MEAAEEVLNAHQGENATDSSSGDDQRTAAGSTGNDESEDQSQDRENALSQGMKRSGKVNAAGRGGFPNPVVAIFSTGNQQIRKRYRSNADAPISQYTAGKSSEPDTGSRGNKEAKHTHSDKRKKELEPRFGRNSNVQGIINEEQHAMLARLEASVSWVQERSIPKLIRYPDLRHDFSDIYDPAVLVGHSATRRHYVGTVLLLW